MCLHSGIGVSIGVNISADISAAAAAAALSLVHLRVEFVLEDVQIVGGGYGNDVLCRVPGGVEDLLGEVQAVHAYVVLPPLPPGGADPPGLEDGPGFAALPGRLQGHVAFGVAVEHAEEVVVGSGHDHTGWGRRRGKIQLTYPLHKPINYIFPRCVQFILYMFMTSHACYPQHTPTFALYLIFPNPDVSNQHSFHFYFIFHFSTDDLV